MIDAILLHLERGLIEQFPEDSGVRVVSLQHVNEDTFTTGVSFENALVVLSYRSTTPGKPVDRNTQILIPDSHEFSIYVAVRSKLPRSQTPNYVEPLGFLKLIRDSVSAQIPPAAQDRPYLKRQHYLSNLAQCRCILYEQQWEVQANYVILEDEGAYAPLKQVRVIGVSPTRPDTIKDIPNPNL